VRWILLLTFGSLGLLALFFGGRWGLKRQRLIFSGAVAQGKVVEPSLVSPPDGNGDDPSQPAARSDAQAAPALTARPAPLIEFTTANGTTVRVVGRAGSGAAPLLEQGARVALVYDPEQPSNALVGARSEALIGPLVIALAGLVFFLMGVGGFFAISSGDRALDLAGKQLTRDQLIFRADAIHIEGTIDRVQRVEGVTPAQYLLVCKGVRPGGGFPEEFLTETFPFAPDQSIIGRTVQVILDPQDSRVYLVELGPLLKEILRFRR